MGLSAAQPKVAVDAEDQLRGVLAEWQSIREELRQRYTWNLQAMGFVIAGVVALLAYGTASIVNADPDSRRWFTLTASISGLAVLIAGIIFTAANFQSVARNAAYIRIFLEGEHPGLNWETRLHRFRTLSGHQLGRTEVIGMMYLLVAIAILSASLVGLVVYEGWYLFPMPAAMFAVALYLVRDMYYQASRRWRVEQYWREIKQDTTRGASPHAS